MEVWQIILYGFAGILALRSLTGLMIRHRVRLEREQAQRDKEQRPDEEQSQATDAEKTAPLRRNGRAA